MTPDHIVCLEDGLKFKTLKRHLQAEHGLSVDEYRKRWDLRDDYPMVSTNYATVRSEMAKSFGLGKKKTRDTAKSTRTRGTKRGA